MPLVDKETDQLMQRKREKFSEELMEATMNLKVGILAIQGAFSEHKTCLARAINDVNTLNKAEGKPGASLDAIEVRERSHVEGLDAMIIPGGESTTMGKSLERNGFGEAIKSWMGQSKKPVVWGTCAGMILLANDLENTKIGGQAHVSRKYCSAALRADSHKKPRQNLLLHNIRSIVTAFGSICYRKLFRIHWL